MLLRKALLITGKVTEPDPLNPGQTVTVVYQRTGRAFGHRPLNHRLALQRRAWVQTPSPSTPLKNANKARFAAAHQSWIDATPPARDLSIPTAIRHNLPLYQAFIKDFCTAHPLAEFMAEPAVTMLRIADDHAGRNNNTPPLSSPTQGNIYNARLFTDS